MTKKEIAGCIMYKWENNQYAFRYDEECITYLNDEIGPTVEFAVVSNPFNSNGWAKTDFYVSINVIDNESGAYSYKWCSGVNDCEPLSLVEESSGNVLISTESDNSIVCAIGYDKAGNESEKTCSEPYKLDKQKPSIEGINDIVVNKNDIVNLSLNVIVNDNLSGIDGIYSYNPTSVNTSIAGTTNITYRVSDMAGNETVITRKVIVDAEAPTVQYTALGNKINANGWSKEDFFVEAVLVDKSGLGIKSAKWCSTTNGTCTPIADMVGSSMTPLISTESNNTRICIQATDNNNKTSEVICSDSYKLDKTAPVAGTINVSSGTLGSNNWYTTNVTLTSTNGSDVLSGHNTTSISTSSITSNTTGTTVTLTTTDKAGNTSNATKVIKIDKTAPTVTPTGSSITITQGDSNQVSSYFTTSYSISGGSVSCTPTNTSTLLVGNQNVSCKATGGNGLTTTSTKTITVSVKHIDNSGANPPILFTNMIPVIWNGSNWVRVEENQQKWYSYDEKMWANAVVLNNGITKSVGQTISESEIAMMYVWIPRYKYTIFGGEYGKGTSQQQINIVFENGIAQTGTVTCQTIIADSGTISESCSRVTNGVSTYTHPAFCFGHRDYEICDGKEVTGIWVGKFENGTTDATCNTTPNSTSCNNVLPVTIKPNVISWRYAQVGKFFTSISNISSNYGMSNADSHMLKNMEWGAVAYLSHSKYGRCDNLICTEIAKNDSSNHYTGRSQGVSPVTSGYSAMGTYTYETPLGQLASTTGNIYGIYDMSGGSLEYVMGTMGYPSDYYGFSPIPPIKYYDKYQYYYFDEYYHRCKLGDATKETLEWYSDYRDLPFGSRYWFARGGRYDGGNSVGIFSFYSYEGDVDAHLASRSVIVANN